MHRLQELVRLHRLGTSARETARLLTMGRNQERQYRQVLTEAGLLEGDADELPALDKLRMAVEKKLPPKLPQQQVSDAEKWSGQIKAMRAKGARAKAIYDTLRQEEGDFGASLWSVKRFVRQLDKAEPVQAEDVVIRVDSEPGEVAQVDFGYVGKLYDPEAGQLRKAWVFVMVLGHSRHQFCRVVFDQRVETWLKLHVAAFEAWGGAPRVVRPDNLKAAVVRCAFGLHEDPALNRSYRELARHYGFKVDPTPPRAPKKKGKVESGVKYVKTNFFQPRDFTDISDANGRLAVWVRDTAGMRTHGTTGKQPRVVFDSVEREALGALPAVPFAFVEWKRARVHPDCHFLFDRRTYPVPWRFIGKDVWIRATPTTVEAYVDDTRVATHERGVAVPRDVLDRYLPDHRAGLRHRSREYWEERALKLDEEVAAYVREVFDSDDALLMLRQVQAIVTHLETFPPARARAACIRARFYANYRYVGVRDILRKGLDIQPLPTAMAPAKGRLESPRYARDPRELLQLPLEATDAPQ